MSERHPQLADGLDIHEVDDGLVAYDAGNDRVHYLNATASVLVTLCDGKRSEGQLATLLRDAWSLDDTPSEEVSKCIAQLRDEGVLR